MEGEYKLLVHIGLVWAANASYYTIINNTRWGMQPNDNKASYDLGVSDKHLTL